MNTLCPDIVKNTAIPHPGFYSLGRKRLYEWTFMEMLQRCQRSFLHINDPDEYWAYRIISSASVSNDMNQKRWENILKGFNGTFRWVQLIASFLCSVNHSREMCFSRYYMVHGWSKWMNVTRMYELLHCIFPTFHHESPDDVIHVDNGEIPMMGLVWACMNDDPTFNEIREHENHSINDGIRSIFNHNYMITPPVNDETTDGGETYL